MRHKTEEGGERGIGRGRVPLLTHPVSQPHVSQVTGYLNSRFFYATLYNGPLFNPISILKGNKVPLLTHPVSKPHVSQITGYLNSRVFYATLYYVPLFSLSLF